MSRGIKISIILIYSLLLGYLKAYTQSVKSSFVTGNTYCQNESVFLQNLSTNYERISWDFSPQDILAIPEIANSINGLNGISGFKLVRADSLYFGFAVSRVDNNLYRIEFGNSLSNTPNITNLGNLGILNFPEGIDIVKDGTKWVGLVGHLPNGGFITRLVWNDLQQPPMADSLSDLGVSSRIRDVQIIKQGSRFIGVFPDFNQGTLIRVDFGNSLLNSITASDIYASSPLNNVQLPIGLSVISKENKWQVLLISAQLKNISVFDLGTDILSTPVEVKSQAFSSFSNLAKIKVTQQVDDYYAYVSTQGGASHIINLKTLSSGDTFQELPISGVPSDYGLDIVKDSSKLYLFSAYNALNRMVFDSVTTVSQTYSEQESPSIYFTAPGTYPITLRAYDADGFYDDTTQYITITSSVAPNVDFSTGANLCFDQAIQFNGTTNGIVNAGDWQWDFGDGNTGTGQQVNHQYAAAGTYTVTLQIVDQGGCTNQMQKDITIYGPPTVDFSYSAPNECSSIPFTFIDQSTGTSPEATYTWNFDDGTSASGDTATHAFAIPQTYLVALTVSQKGCNATTTKSVTVNEGPDVAFVSPTGCAGESLTFQNQSTGNYITGYHWDFGDGYTATTENPNHTYADYGSYLVQLGAQTSNGCDYTLTQTVDVEDVPIADFSYTLSCEGQEVQFTSACSVNNANISAFHWDFGTNNPGDTSVVDNPQFTYASTGDYLVHLAVNSDQGCGASVTKTIHVLESPKIGAEYTIGCIGSATQFQDVSTTGGAGDFQYYYWEVRDAQNTLVTTSSQASFTYTFDNAGSYYVYHAVQPQNLCNVDELDTILIPGAPQPDFSALAACPGYSMVLKDLTNYQGGVPATISWEGDFQGIYSGDSVSIVFPDAGAYLVTEKVETENSCTATITKTITVPARSVVAISASSTVGGPPLQVGFSPADTTNLGEVQWFIEGISDSPTASTKFQYTFNGEGVYNVGMIYQLKGQCLDTSYQEVSVVKPVLNLAVSNVQVMTNGADHQILVALKNTGNLPMDSVRLAVQLDQTFTFYEWYPALLAAGERVTYPIKSMLGETEFSRVKSICVSATVYDQNIQETTAGDNSACLNLYQGFFVGKSYPNPSTGDQLNIPLLLPTAGTVKISFIRGDGQEAYPQEYKMEEGPQLIHLNTKPLGQGIYLLKVSYNQQVKIQRIAITR